MSANQATPFPIGDILKRSWDIFTANIGPFIGITLIGSLAIFIINSVTMVGGSLLIGPFMLGLFRMALDASRGRKVEFADGFYGFNNFLPAFLVGLLVTIFTTIGAILCILPGLFVALIYWPVYCFLYDDRLDFWPAMEKSREFVMANLGQWALLFVVVIVLNLLGAMACGVGILITAPLCLIATAIAYDTQRGATTSHEAITPEASEF